MSTARRSTSSASPGAEGGSITLRVLKKYPNRRLYDSQSSSYITLADVKKMVLDGEAFEVRDAKTGEDLTRSILLQIILEEESAGVPMFSTETLAQIIRFYGHAMQGVMGSMLEQNLRAMADMQSRVIAGQTAPMAGLSNMMSSYMEQSQKLMAQVQEQFGAPAGSLFPGFPAAKK
jgi:polyhydroxyalkanoate synthesis repressor PhaR